MREVLEALRLRLPLKPPARVVVAMSGGVDSSVAAALLKHLGFEVHGIMLKLWSEPGREHENRCCTLGSQLMARQVARNLEIPFEVLDARDAFYRTVVQAFLTGYRQGQTPNPCLVCNREFRWHLLLVRARELQAHALATGHHARVHWTKRGPVLLRGRDRSKDQSYVLSVLRREQLARTLLPIGELTKAEVRRLAEAWRLPVAHRPESQDLCFAGGDYRAFLRRNAPEMLRPGPILNVADGASLGQHPGLALFTIGQRRGLGIAVGTPLYVIAKDPRRNALWVGPQEARYTSGLRALHANWLLEVPPKEPFDAEVQIRYTAPAVPARIVPEGPGAFRVRFRHPVADVTPGQAAVVYQGDRCLGLGIIHESLPAPSQPQDSSVK